MIFETALLLECVHDIVDIFIDTFKTLGTIVGVKSTNFCYCLPIQFNNLFMKGTVLDIIYNASTKAKADHPQPEAACRSPSGPPPPFQDVHGMCFSRLLVEDTYIKAFDLTVLHS